MDLSIYRWLETFCVVSLFGLGIFNVNSCDSADSIASIEFPTSIEIQSAVLRITPEAGLDFVSPDSTIFICLVIGNDGEDVFRSNVVEVTSVEEVIKFHFDPSLFYTDSLSGTLRYRVEKHVPDLPGLGNEILETDRVILYTRFFSSVPTEANSGNRFNIDWSINYIY